MPLTKEMANGRFLGCACPAYLSDYSDILKERATEDRGETAIFMTAWVKTPRALSFTFMFLPFSATSFKVSWEF